MRACTFVIPGDWLTLTGGYRYDRKLVLALRESGWTVDLCRLADNFPWPDEAALADAERHIGALPDGTLVIADGLAFGALPDLAHRHAARLRWVALVHHPLYLETGLDEVARNTLLVRERQALAAARHVIVTSETTARDVAAMDVPVDRISVVEPGTDRALPAMRQPRAGERTREQTGERTAGLRLLCVATLIPRKGHAVLLEALAGLQALDWTLDCVGSPERDPATAELLRRMSARPGLAGRVRWLGEQDEAALANHYAQADLFVLPSFHEGYGMVITEALAHGLPVLTTTGGALARTLPAEAGVKVPPGDAASMREALQRLIGDPVELARHAAGARSVRDRLPTWADTATRFAAVLEAVA